ncbi:hypothetical protein COY93_01560 [Candidatus Uhrbacteria bacterium CG_4_10_14_0_8_um_filter_58_22]|uniref:Uncharacterized protein n=1 Tax=Candidatus Uhrbacteria bacterium CG_4_10_14_0_8_um_filter_58_22 TaxID=1975029 RepID=A0A2M7QAG9_9BACT|nr:MAG: hypothetical protein AUJ19_03280 [Parcubacteria group bacterium CG1_02_58_44]PIY62971.1 MAG: hypothetical protein COY93_01560 [Candidatus Uhrbacteria bacterium CG_4_10_14_0_8_um_filter_58_22]
MKKMLYLILIPAMLAFGLVFSLGASGYGSNGSHYGQGIMMPCLGSDCGNLLQKVTCSAHCLTSGLLPTAGLTDILTVLPYVFAVMAFATVVVGSLVSFRPRLLAVPASPSSTQSARTIVKRE